MAPRSGCPRGRQKGERSSTPQVLSPEAGGPSSLLAHASLPAVPSPCCHTASAQGPGSPAVSDAPSPAQPPHLPGLRRDTGGSCPQRRWCRKDGVKAPSPGPAARLVLGGRGRPAPCGESSGLRRRLGGAEQMLKAPGSPGDRPGGGPTRKGGQHGGAVLGEGARKHRSAGTPALFPLGTRAGSHSCRSSHTDLQP